MSADYPAHWEADVLVTDGGVAHLRPIVPDDAAALVDFHAQLSARTRYLRYFSAYRTIPPRDLARFTHHDNVNRVALAIWLGNQIVAVGRFDRLPTESGNPRQVAEVAFVVADAHQGRGIGSVLLEHLVEIGRELSITQFEALVLAENRTMLRVFLDAGFAPSSRLERNEVSLEFDIAATDLTRKVMAERELRSDSRSIERLLHPRSVAVVGASTDPTKIGHLVLQNLASSGFTGSIFAVNPHASTIEGIPSYPRIADIKENIDLAVLAIPAAQVSEVVAQCGARGVHGLVVISAGFGESGDEQEREVGLQAQRALISQARANGMRVVGPNCLGVLNTAATVALNASLAPVAPLAGRAGFFCQSGALGVAVLGEAARRGLGVSTFVSAGNRADVSGNDLLQYWETDPATELALLYLESFGNPRKFGRIARRFARRKPIVAVKSGRGSIVAGLQHTSVDVPDASVQALFEASGIIRTATLEELFDVALLLATQPLPSGDRVAVVGHSTALGVLVVDALTSSGLAVARLVDVGVDAKPADFGNALDAALAAEDVDAVIGIFVPPMRRGEEGEVAARMRDAVARQPHPKPVLSTFLGFDGVPSELAVEGPLSPMPGSIPSYSSPERAVAALTQVTRYARWRRRDVGQIPELTDLDAESARTLVDRVLAESPAGQALSRSQTQQVLGCYGISIVASEAVTGQSDAVAAARRLGWPVALMAAGVVRLHLGNPGDVEQAWVTLGLSEDSAVIVQKMAPRGIDTVLRVHDDRSFGALISFAVGGLARDLLKDQSYAVVPMTAQDATELISGPKAFPLLTGYGGAEPADIPALVELAIRLSRLADDLPEVVECTLEPVLAAGNGAHVLSATIQLAAPTASAELGARRLRGL